MRILIIPDKFKGSLSSRQAAEAIAQGWASVRREDTLDLQPMADGGDGFGEVFGNLLLAEKKSCQTIDFMGKAREANWWHNQIDKTAVLETAEVIGHTSARRDKLHPFQIDTFGLGQVLKEIGKFEVSELYIGLGGSATNDGGFGLARSLGWKFWNGQAQEITKWTGLDELERAEPPAKSFFMNMPKPKIFLVVDVQNPLLGPSGATHIYGPQKGLLESELDKAESCLARLALIMERHFQKDFAHEPGSGAAGGLGFGLSVFYGGTYRSGAAVFSDLGGIKRRIQANDCIITGEGSLDKQSLMGKGVGFIADLSEQNGKPCICLAGSISLEAEAIPWKNFQAYAIYPDLASKDYALANAFELLKQLGIQAAQAAGKN